MQKITDKLYGIFARGGFINYFVIANGDTLTVVDIDAASSLSLQYPVLKPSPSNRASRVVGFSEGLGSLPFSIPGMLNNHELTVSSQKPGQPPFGAHLGGCNGYFLLPG